MDNLMNYIKKSKIDATRIEEIFRDCLFKDNEIKDNQPLYNYSIAEGITSTFVFSSKRLNKHKEEILKIICYLPKIEKGISFLNMCVDEDDILWTGSQQRMEQLLVLGLATDLLKYATERPMWEFLPGQMPYVILDKTMLHEEVIGSHPETFKEYTRKSK